MIVRTTYTPTEPSQLYMSRNIVNLFLCRLMFTKQHSALFVKSNERLFWELLTPS